MTAAVQNYTPKFQLLFIDIVGTENCDADTNRWRVK